MIRLLALLGLVLAQGEPYTPRSRVASVVDEWAAIVTELQAADALLATEGFRGDLALAAPRVHPGTHFPVNASFPSHPLLAVDQPPSSVLFVRPFAHVRVRLLHVTDGATVRPVDGVGALQALLRAHPTVAAPLREWTVEYERCVLGEHPVLAAAFFDAAEDGVLTLPVFAHALLGTRFLALPTADELTVVRVAERTDRAPVLN